MKTDSTDAAWAAVRAAEPGAMSRDEIAGLLADVRRARACLDAVEVQASRRLRELAAAGLGVGLLMAVDGDRDPRLTDLGAWPGPSPPAFLWVLLHPDVGRARRVRIVADYLFDYLRALEGVFVNERGRLTP